MMSLGFGLGLTNRLASAAPPVPFAATILPDGVTARVLFTGHVISGSATAGLTFDTAISAGAYAGITLDLTVGLVTIDASGLALVYDAGVGSLAGVSGPISSFTISVSNTSWSGGALWTPADHGTNLDYFTDSDLTRLFQTAADTTPVTTAGDPVGRWRGQRNAAVFNQGTAANRPAYRSGGIEFDSLGGISKSMSHSRAIALTSPLTVFISTTASTGFGGGEAISFYGNHTAGGGTGVIGSFAGQPNYNAAARNLNTVTTTQKSGGAKEMALSWDGASGTFFNNDGTATACPTGTASSAFNGFSLVSFAGLGKPLVHAMSISLGTMTADDFKKHAWWARYAS